jgi:malate synthase
LWQWVHNGAKLDDGRTVTPDLYRSLVPDVLAHIKEMVGEEQYRSGKYELAADLISRLVTEQDFTDFLTLPAYEQFK